MKVKFPYSIQRSMIKILPFIATAIMSASCQKEPTPIQYPNQPTDTIIPVTPHYPDTIYIPFELKLSNLPNTNTIAFYADKTNVRRIIMDLVPMDSLYTSGWGWRSYNKIVDSLNKRCEISPTKVVGRGTIIAERVIPDSIHNASGLPRSDSIALKNMGFDISTIFSRHNH